MTLEEKEQAMDAISAINEFLANSNCEDFMIKYYNGEKLCLIGSVDLCYYSEMEILFEQVSYISMYTYFSLWKLKNEPFKIKFDTNANDIDSNFEIQIGEDMDGKIHRIWCDSLRVHIGVQGLDESVFS